MASSITSSFSKVTTISRTITSNQKCIFNDSILAIVEGRGQASGEIGFASYDKNNSLFILSQYMDDISYSSTLNKIHIIEPKEIILNSSQIIRNCLLKNIINENFPSLKMVFLERRCFNAEKGLNQILNLCCKEFFSIEQDIAGKYYSQAAAAGLLSYIEHSRSICFIEKSLNIIYSSLDDTMIIDPKTSKSLEILTNNINSNETLFAVLNYTKTTNGERFLKKSLIEPLIDKNSINTRQDCIQELISSISIFDKLNEILEKLNKMNLTTVVYSFIQVSKVETNDAGEKKIDNFLYLKNILEIVNPLKNVLKICDNYLFKVYASQLEDDGYEIMLNIINSIIKENCRFTKITLKRNSKYFCIKDSISDQLDVIKKLMEIQIKKIENILSNLNDEYSIIINYKYDNLKKFYFFISINDESKLKKNNVFSEEFLKIKKRKNIIEFSTYNLEKLNFEYERILTVCYNICDTLLNEKMNEMRSYVFCLHKLVETITMIDFLISLVKASYKHKWTRPIHGTSLSLENSCHPLYNHLNKNKIAKNSINLDRFSNVAVITGPNNSGKSTFIKQVAIIQLLFQIGCFIPAKSGTLFIVKRIFARIGSDDDILSNCSSFVNELKEINYILRNSVENSLTIIDEFGRGTTYEDGWPFCWSITERFIFSDNYLLLTTHFQQLTMLAYHYLTVNNYYMEALDYELNERQMLKFTYKLCSGVNNVENYMLKLAEHTELPRSIIKEAYEIQKKIPNKEFDIDFSKSKIYNLAKLQFTMGRLLFKYYNKRNQSDFNYEEAVDNLLRIFLVKENEIQNSSSNISGSSFFSLEFSD